MKKIVNFCGNCPFLCNEKDVYGDSTKYLCILSKNLDLYFYYVDNVDGILDENSTPDWCPLKKEEYTFSFKNVLYGKLEETHIIEECPKDSDDNDIESEIIKSIDEIKNQMIYIEEASAKLQEMFNNYSEE